MNEEEKITLSKLVKEYNTEDTTEKIRKLKHSKKIHQDMLNIENLKKKYPRIYKDNKKQFEALATKQASFLNKYYPELFIRIISNEIDLSIMEELLRVLSLIEDGKLDQHEASYRVGILLKELYVDPKLRKDSIDFNKEKHDISWKEYKNL